MQKFNYSGYGAFKSVPMQSKFFALLKKKLRFKNRYLSFLVSVPRDLPVVEIGCGNGRFILDLLNEGFKDVKGVEPSQTYTFLADKSLISHEFASPYLSNIRESTLGLVVSLDVFEHIPRAELLDLIKLIESRLVDGGFLVFRIPNMSSPLALVNFYGDLSHTTPLNEFSIPQLIFDTGLYIESIKAEPFYFPVSPKIVIGIIVWPLFCMFYRILFAAFGMKTRILTPNLVCVLRKKETGNPLLHE
jgi:SAM-dependent methyltransferase